MNYPGFRLFQKGVIQEPKHQSWNAGMHSVVFSLQVFIKCDARRKHKQNITVNAQGLKGMWTVAQGCFVDAELRVLTREMEVLVDHSFVVGDFSLLCHMPDRLWRWPTMIFRYKTAPAHMYRNCWEKQPWVSLLQALCPAAYAIVSMPIRLLWFHVPMGDCLLLLLILFAACCNEVMLDGFFFSSSPCSIPVKWHRRAHSFCSTDANTVTQDSELRLECLSAPL